MKKHIFVAGISMLALGFSATMASAACDFEHPKQAKALTSSLVQAFVSCNNPGGNVSNNTTEGGFPSCSPPQTIHQQEGNPPTGWTWDEGKGKGTVTFKAAKNKVPGQPANSADLAVTLQLAGVLQESTQEPATGSGELSTLARATFEDRAGGGTSMTVTDFPAPFPFGLVDGKVKLKTSANALLTGIGQPALPGCSSIEVVDIKVKDSAGTVFANLGTFLPDLPN